MALKTHVDTPPLHELLHELECVTSARPKGVFISSRMAELGADRSVAYRALAALGLQPVLFEREPSVKGDPQGIEAMNVMTTECPRMLAIYHRSVGERDGVFGPLLSAIEYELIGRLCVEARGSDEQHKQFGDQRWQRNWFDNAGETWPLAKREEIDRMIVALKRHFTSEKSQSVLVFLKCFKQVGAQQWNDTSGGQRTKSIGDFFDTVPYAEQYSARIRGLVTGCIDPENVFFYHEPTEIHSRLWEVRRKLLEHLEPELREGFRVRTFKLGLHGPDFPGLLQCISQFLLHLGVNITRIDHTSNEKQVVLTLLGSALCKRAKGKDSDRRHEDRQFEHDLTHVEEHLEKLLIHRASASAKSRPDTTGGIGSPYSKPLRLVPFDDSQADDIMKVELSVVDTPGIFFEVARTIRDLNVHVLHVSLGATPSRGLPQTRIHLTCAPEQPAHHSGDGRQAERRKETTMQQRWSFLETKLINLIGVNAVTIERWEVSASSRSTPRATQKTILKRRP